MQLRVFGLLLMGVMVTSAAHLLLKAGVRAIGHFDFVPANLLPVGIQVATSPFILLGICCYVAGMLIWILVLSRTDLSVAYPVSSIAYLITSLSAYYFFNESLTPMRLAGIVVIMAGVFLISRTA